MNETIHKLALRDQAVEDVKALQTKYDADTVEFKKIESTVGKIKDGVVSRIDAHTVANEVVVHVPPDTKVHLKSLPVARTRRSEEITTAESDGLSTSRSADTYSSSGDTPDHEHVDDRLVIKLLHELQALVGPKFGFTVTKQSDSLCDTLAADLDHFLGVKYRISQYLKESLQSQKARSAESESGWFKSLLGANLLTDLRTMHDDM